MFSSIVIAMFSAWFLSLFGFDNIVIQGFKILFKMNIDTSTYYFVFVIVALIIYSIDFIKK